MPFDGTSGPCWDADIPYSAEHHHRMRIAQFGEGYEQRTIDGLNPKVSVWSLTWEMRPSQVVMDMEDYLSSRYGAAFPWLAPTASSTILVFCDKWSVNWAHKGRKDFYGSLSAEFRKAYGASIITVPLP